MKYACVDLHDVQVEQLIVAAKPPAYGLDDFNPNHLRRIAHVCNNYTVKTCFGEGYPVEVDYLTCAQCSYYTPNQSRPLVAAEVQSKGFCYSEG